MLYNWQLLVEAGSNVKNCADLGGCNILRDLHNSLRYTVAALNNCFIIQSKYFEFLTSLRPRRLSSKTLAYFSAKFQEIN